MGPGERSALLSGPTPGGAPASAGTGHPWTPAVVLLFVLAAVIWGGFLWLHATG